MKYLAIRSFLILILLLNALISLNAQTPNFNRLIGKWENQLKSTLEISNVNPTTFQITGQYTSVDAGTYPIIGYVNFQPIDPSPKVNNVLVISFAVRWGNIGTITTWNGFLQYDSLKITGQWLLSQPTSRFIWDHILVGQDIFYKK